MMAMSLNSINSDVEVMMVDMSSSSDHNFSVICSNLDGSDIRNNNHTLMYNM